MTQITNDMKTDWFPAEVNPVRKGFYETKLAGVDEIWLRYWDHNSWWYDGAVEFVECIVQDREWRGLTEEGALRAQWPWPKK